MTRLFARQTRAVFRCTFNNSRDFGPVLYFTVESEDLGVKASFVDAGE